MTRIFGHYVPLEMMLLWIVELTGCFVLGYVLLNSGMGGIAVPSSHSDVNMVAVDAAAVLAVSVGLTSFAIGLYQTETFLRLQRLFAKTAVAGALSFPAIWILGHLVGIDFTVLMGHGVPKLLKMLAAWVVLVMIIRLAFSYSLRMNLFTRRIVLVTADAPGDTLALEGANRTGRAIQHLRNGVFETVGAVMRFDPAKDDANRLIEQLRRRRVWGIVMVAPGPNGDAAEQIMRSSGAALGGIKVWRDRVFWEGQLRRVDIDQLEGTAPDFKALARSGWLQASIRRASDIALSLFLLSFTLPLMLFAALAIRLDSRGPIFYRQERVGLHGRIFTLCKFRSMRTDAEVTGPVWAAQKDNRVTRVGLFLRRTRIDELPQLINVLRGEMSFIGPRPERPHFVSQLAEIIPFYRERAHVKPGLTGWAQVSYPYGASVEDARMKLSYDLYYIKQRSLFLDVLILFATVRVILFQEGAR